MITVIGIMTVIALTIWVLYIDDKMQECQCHRCRYQRQLRKRITKLAKADEHVVANLIERHRTEANIIEG